MRSMAEHKTPQKPSLGIISNTDAANFLAMFPKIVDNIVDQKLVSASSVVNERIKKVLSYTVPYGSHVTPHLLIYSYKFIENYNNTFAVENMNEAFQMAWCLNIMLCMSLMIDDILDNSELRSGKKTWYKLEGSQAICDSFLLQSCYLKLLEKYFSNKDNYIQILDTFNKAGIDATVGETMEFDVCRGVSFTIENFREIAQQRATPIGFYAPLKLATLLSDLDINLEDSSCDVILKELGIWYQIQNDFQDIYGENLIGKKGNDIQENKCTILIVTALEKGSPEQKKTLIECYGHDDPESVGKVKAIYRELELEKEYDNFEDKSQRLISTELMKIKDDFLRNLMKHYSSLSFGRLNTEYFAETTEECTSITHK